VPLPLDPTGAHGHGLSAEAEQGLPRTIAHTPSARRYGRLPAGHEPLLSAALMPLGVVSNPAGNKVPPMQVGPVPPTQLLPSSRPS